MHAPPFIPFIKPALDALKASLGAARKRLGKRKYDRLLSAAAQELLRQDPDVSVAEAQLALDGQRGKFQRKRNVSDRKRERGHHANVFLQSVLQRAKRKA